jgi:L-asparaginase
LRKRVYVAYAGGTIGMRGTSAGYAPAPGFLEEQLLTLPELGRPEMPEVELEEYRPLLDSSNTQPQDWLRIARDIAEDRQEYDGFVVLHGTDTMAYTASALAFILQGLEKPVILTGSQIPLSEVRNDARGNLLTSLLLAAHHPVPEVCLFFGSRLLRGCRSVKVSADGFDAFASPNFPALGTVGVDISIEWSLVHRPRRLGQPAVPERLDATVGALRLFPGISARTVRNMLQPPLQGLVLEAYGTGNAPDRDRELLAAITEAVGRGVVVVVCTQCLRGSVALGSYVTGSALREAGAVSGYDMTAEAALAKLHYLVGSGRAADEVRTLMQDDLCGELTRPGGE